MSYIILPLTVGPGIIPGGIHIVPASVDAYSVPGVVAAVDDIAGKSQLSGSVVENGSIRLADAYVVEHHSYRCIVDAVFVHPSDRVFTQSDDLIVKVKDLVGDIHLRLP